MVGDPANERGRDTVLFRAGSVRHAGGGVVGVVIRPVVEEAQLQVGLVIHDQSRSEVQGPVVILRREDGLGDIRGRGLRFAQYVVETSLKVQPGPGRPTHVLGDDVTGHG